MIIHIDKDGAVALLQPEDTRSFKIISAARYDHTQLAKALAGVGDLDGADHLWVSQAWIRAQTPLAESPEWTASFEKMLNYARSKQWLREDGAIRAHIELE